MAAVTISFHGCSCIKPQGQRQDVGSEGADNISLDPPTGVLHQSRVQVYKVLSPIYVVMGLEIVQRVWSSCKNGRGLEVGRGKALREFVCSLRRSPREVRARSYCLSGVFCS